MLSVSKANIIFCSKIGNQKLELLIGTSLKSEAKSIFTELITEKHIVYNKFSVLLNILKIGCLKQSWTH